MSAAYSRSRHFEMKSPNELKAGDQIVVGALSEPTRKVLKVEREPRWTGPDEGFWVVYVEGLAFPLHIVADAVGEVE